MIKRNFIIAIVCLIFMASMAHAQKRIRVETPMLLEHGWITFNNEDEGFTGTIAVTTGGTYYGFINGIEGDVSAAFTFHNDDTDGDYLKVSNSFDGHYFADFGFSAGTAGGGEVVHCAIFINDTKTGIQFEREMGPGGDVGDAGKSGSLDLSSQDKVRLKCTTNGNGKEIQVKHGSLMLVRLGD
jgi:hypothetical protein